MIVNFSVPFLLGVILTVVSVGAIPEPAFRNVRNKFIWGNESFPEVSARIHGGYDAEQGQFKFMVFLLISPKGNGFKSLTCSGSVIANDWVLTAAHCVYGSRSSVIVVAGKADLRSYIKVRLLTPLEKDIDEDAFGVQERRVSHIFVHPKYSSSDYSNDFALLLLERPFLTGPNIRPPVEILPISQRKMTSPMICTVVGWGLNEEDRQTFKLMFAADVEAKTPKLCHNIRNKNFLCLEQGGPGICKGDSGSPLVCGNQVWGVASFAISQNENPSCLDQEEEFYSGIYEVLPWINETLNGSGSSGSLNIRVVLGVFYLGLSFLWFLR